MRHIIFSVCCLAIACLGCAKPTETLEAVSKVEHSGFKIDSSRLTAPSGWKNFEYKSEDYLLGLKDLDVATADPLLQDAWRFVDSDSRPHPHDLRRIPGFMLESAEFFAETGEVERALDLLQRMASKELVTSEDLDDEYFPSLAENTRFIKIRSQLKSKSDTNVLAKLMIRTPPLFALDEIAAIPMSPSFVAPQTGSVTVLFIGTKLSNFQYAAEATKTGANVIAIVGAADKQVEGLQAYRYDGDIRRDFGLRSDTTFIADKNNQVLAYLLPLSEDGLCTAIVADLQER